MPEPKWVPVWFFDHCIYLIWLSTRNCQKIKRTFLKQCSFIDQMRSAMSHCSTLSHQLDQWEVWGFDGKEKSHSLHHRFCHGKGQEWKMDTWVMVTVIFALRYHQSGTWGDHRGIWADKVLLAKCTSALYLCTVHTALVNWCLRIKHTTQYIWGKRELPFWYVPSLSGLASFMDGKSKLWSICCLPLRS